MQRSLRILAGTLAALGVLAGAPALAEQLPPGAVKDGKLTPGLPAVPTFGDGGAPACPKNSLNDVLPSEVGRAAKAAGRPAPQMAGPLCAIAATFANWKESAPPRDAVIAFVSAWFGLPVAARQVLIGKLPSDEDAAVAENLAGNVMGFAKRAVNPRYAAVAVLLPRADRFAQRESRIVVVLEDHVLSIDPPFPRRLELGQTAVLSGHLNGATDPKVTVSDVSGQVTTPDQAPGDAFKASVACGTHPGSIFVQVTGVVDGQRVQVANLELPCGKDLPTCVDVDAPKVAIEGPGQDRQVLAAINAERADAGLPALAWDDAVAKVAAAVADGLADDKRRATVASPAEVNAALLKAGAGSALVLVNPAQGTSVSDAAQRLVSSPTHRANMLNPEVTSAGVGSVAIPGKDGKNVVFLTEIFVKVASKVESKDLRSQLVAAINERRAEAKMPLLKVDGVLQSAAQRYAEELAAAGGNLPESRDDQLLADVKKSFKGTVSMLAGASTVPLDYAKQPKMVAAGPDSLGVGIAQGDHPTLGRNTFFVVILRGTHR
ncbi:MAG TPA: CAP domain-containing protein [Anaeromyxobacteraceae bacterium]|nr:CAP domain-containing protein [Anaeromyxobacteraceae bacterium]